MLQNRNQIRVGDILYEVSVIRKKVIRWRIDEIFFENYVSGWKIIIKATAINCEIGTRRFFEADLFILFDSKEEAEEKLNEI